MINSLSLSHYRLTIAPFVLCIFTVTLPLSPAVSSQSLPIHASDSPTYVLDKVIINNQNIFDSDAARIYQLVNKLHWITRKKVIQREVWLDSGDTFNREDIAEIERNIRNLDLFARVRVVPESSESNPGKTNLLVNTYDRLSIVASAGGSFLGGIGEVEFSVGDKNLLGLGHELQFGYSENTEGELLGSVSYDNVLLWSTDVFAGFQAGETEEGNFAEINVRDRFQHHLDTDAWSLRLQHETTRLDFFEQGETVAEVPRRRESVRIDRLWRRGHRLSYFHFGPVLTATRNDFGAAIGPQADAINVPEDNSTVFVGASLTSDRTREFRTVRGIDSLSFEQDITLGTNVELAIGFEQDERESATRTLPTVFLRGRSQNALGQSNYLNIGIGSSFQWDDSEFDSWSISTAATWFNRKLDNQTFAARVIYESAFDASGLPPTQTLGEDNGLRGYPAREFNAEQSLLLNLEYRYTTPITLASLELGVIGFTDAGWVADRAGSRSLDNLLDEPITSAGLGIRIGSPQLLGSTVIRMDFAYPFHRVEGERFSPTFSLAVGHVFGFRP